MKINLKVGDIVLIHHKKAAFARSIRKVTSSDYNHIAWILTNGDIDEAVYLEAEPNGIQIKPLTKYWNNPKLYKVKIIRLIGIPPNKLRNAVYSALSSFKYTCNPLEYICKYSVLLLRHLFKYLKKYSLYGAFTCSQFVAQFLEMETGFRLLNKNPIDIVPGDFEKIQHKVVAERK